MEIRDKRFDSKWVLLLLIVVVSLFLISSYQEKTAFEKENISIKTIEDVKTFEEVKVEENPALIKAKRRMVEVHLKGRDIVDEKVLDVMAKVPRHEFVDESLGYRAYDDNPLPIGEGQTISQPYVVALMTQSLNIKKGEKVLEIGTGSAYQAAVLAELTDEVYTIEIKEKLAKSAEERLKKLGYDKVMVKHADGYFGWDEHAPFDVIIITAAVNHIPPTLLAQLNEGGRLILPLGSTTYYQTLTLLTKKDGDLTAQHITSVRFVPMTGEAEKRG